jgi:hypothetical protein
MNDLKAIHVEGKMTLIFDENVSLQFEKPKENLVETPDLSNKSFEHFLDVLFTEGNMSCEKQAKIWQMSVTDFCHMYDAALAYQGFDNPIPPGIPRMQFLQNVKQYKCPCCKQEGSFEVLDGHLKCTACLRDFGDVDELCEVLTM